MTSELIVNHTSTRTRLVFIVPGNKRSIGVKSRERLSKSVRSTSKKGTQRRRCTCRMMDRRQRTQTYEYEERVDD